MPRKVIPLLSRKDMKRADVDQCLSEIVELTSDKPAFDIVAKYFPGREKFFILHRWLETESLINPDLHKQHSTYLLDAIQSLSAALLAKADNREHDFFTTNRKTGKRSSFETSQAINCAAALYFWKKEKGSEREIELWWFTLCSKNNELPSNLAKRAENTIAADDNNDDKSMLLGFYAGFMDGTDQEKNDHAKLLKNFTNTQLRRP